jgi:hypothetical protein
MKLLFAILALAAAAVTAAPEPSAQPLSIRVVSEEIRHTSPDGKYALRITYDRATNEGVLSKEESRPNGGIFSQTIESIDLVSLPDKNVLRQLLEGGMEFHGVTLLWSPDSKWCAFYYSYPKVGYTDVYRVNGAKAKLAHALYELENLKPMRWVKPGVLDLGNVDGVSTTATFNAKGKVRYRDKKS